MLKELAKFTFEGKAVTMFVTDEYKRFKFLPENRHPELEERGNTHSRQIEESIEQNNYLFSPVTVSDGWKIIDGQHRIAALRELNLPVYVAKIDGYNGKEIQALNSANKNWDKKDHANYWSKKGKRDYTDLLEMHVDFPRLKFGTIATLLSGNEARIPKIFNHGKWEITKNLKTMRTHLTQLMELAEIQPKITLRAAAEAYLSVAANSKYNHRRMKENLDSYGGKHWEILKSKEANLMMFSGIYNHARPERNRVEFASQKDMALVAKSRMKKAA